VHGGHEAIICYSSVHGGHAHNYLDRMRNLRELATS